MAMRPGLSDEPEGPPEPVMIECAKCRVPILSLWAPGDRGLISGSHVLVADWLFHPECWDAVVSDLPEFAE